MSYTREEVDFLAAGEFDHPELGLSPATQLRDAEFLRARYGSFARAVTELLHARAKGKLPGPRWLADADSVQQATPGPVAAFRAAYLAGAGFDCACDITCSIGTEGHYLAGAGLDYVGSDLDSSRVRMARHNLPGAKLLLADALAPATTLGPGTVLIADPARRAGGRRISDPAQLLPPLPDVLAAHAGAPMAIKCAPGLDFSQWTGQVDVVSLDGGVKEACLYTPELAAEGVARRAVLLRSDRGARTAGTGDSGPGSRANCSGDGGQGAGGGGIGKLGVSVDIVDDSAPAAELPGAGAVSTYLIDPDGAIVRGGLVKHYAAREGLWQLDERIAYLTGPRIPEGASGFAFIESVAPKRLKAALAAHDCGAVEILIRGVNADPDELRKRLKLKGSRQMAVVLTRIGSQPIAFVCGPRVVSSRNH
ncbi:SAM-dependent methyltransferase [Corynebacterium lizhenjunii]|uniref:SAM-dependent methyltransferase n=1 Tax=Corynebacterium lizhenjunii TaxID=2709394 RepID=A0A7T0KH59_9CORY|nr:SAM-dependent methyltransferase [Corynebacterium lizhenjunii]QPK80020.1 SAM-dependent methyltransferase [Corynebacterium lizhenjunii]